MSNRPAAHACRAAALASLICLAPSAAPASEPAPPAIVSPGWLSERLDSEGLLILDARSSLRDFLGGHIAGAQPLSGENLRSTARGVPGEIDPPEAVAAIVARLGARPEGTIVVYAAGTDPDATLVATALRSAGFARVSVLDGGIEGWTAAGRALTADRTATAPGPLRLAPPEPILAGLDEVRRAVAGKEALILDVRPQEQFEAGRIPGAVNRPWKQDLVPSGSPGAGTSKDEKALAEEYAAIGVTRDRPVIVYCNSGHMASESFYQLRFRLGFPNVKLYDGSMLEWSMHEDLPKEKGPAPAAGAGAKP